MEGSGGVRSSHTPGLSLFLSLLPPLPPPIHTHTLCFAIVPDLGTTHASARAKRHGFVHGTILNTLTLKVDTTHTQLPSHKLTLTHM